METRIMTYLRAVRVATVEEIAEALDLDVRGRAAEIIRRALVGLSDSGAVILFNDTVNAGQVTGAMVR